MSAAKRINIPDSELPRIVVVGAGFGGLTFAKRLAKSGYQVVLLDRNNYHQFQPLFYQVAMSGLEPSSISFPIRKIFQNRKNVYIRVANVEAVDIETKELITSLGTLTYDHLVLAMGADTNFFGNAQVQHYAIPMKSVSEALFLRNAILEDYERAINTADYNDRQELIDIVIVGGGPTGVEIAGALAEMKKYILPKDYAEMNSDEVDIYLVQAGDRILPSMSEKSSKTAERFLVDLGIIVRKNTRVVDFDGMYAYLDDDTAIRTNKVIWAAGIKGNTIKGLPKESYIRGDRLAVDDFLELKAQKDIFVIGDLSYMETKDYPNGHPQVAQTAIQQAQTLAKNFKNIQSGKERIPFSYVEKGAMATIGRNRAVADLPRFHFKGFFAWIVWLVVHLFALIGTKNKVFVFLNWVWSYLTYDQSLRLIIRPRIKPFKRPNLSD